MMTGDLMLNLSRTQQSSNLLPKQQQQQQHQKKIDPLKYNPNHYPHTTTIHYPTTIATTIATHHNHHHHHHHHHHNSMPSSPNDNMLTHHHHHHQHYHQRAGTYKSSSSASTSPVSTGRRDGMQGAPGSLQIDSGNKNTPSSFGFVRTSRSEDHLQFQKDPSMSAVDIDIDDDVTSSLNTLLDPRPEVGLMPNERIVWTYNAPVSSPVTSCCANGGSSSSTSSSSSSSTSPQRSLSPASPTSVSSSVMSSNSGSRRFPPVQATPGVSGASTTPGGFLPANGDLSQSEAISNMSSPDYNDEETMDILSARDIMMVSDPSDSDSTILASEPPQRRLKVNPQDSSGDHRIVIQVKGLDKETASVPRNTSPRQTKRRGNPGSGEQAPQIGRAHV